MAIGDILTWAVQSQSAPAHVARLLQTILLNEGVVDKAGNSFQVQEGTGSDMNVTVGSGTVGDLAVIEGDDAAGQGVYVHEAQNGTVTRAVAASDPSNPRIDLVVLQNYDDEADSSGNNDADVEVIQGTPAASPSAPALPDSAISLATIEVGAGVTAVTNANITDVRVEASLTEDLRKVGPLGVLGYAQITSGQGGITTETDITGLSVTVDVAAGRRIRITGKISAVSTAADRRTVLRIKESTTQLGHAAVMHPYASAITYVHAQTILTPSSGSHTYKLAAEHADGSGSSTAGASADRPSFILVEDIGPA